MKLISTDFNENSAVRQQDTTKGLTRKRGLAEVVRHMPLFVPTRILMSFPSHRLLQSLGLLSCVLAMAAVSQAQPAVVSVTPTNGSGSSGTLTLVYSDPNGASDLQSAQVIINSSVSGVSSCYLWVDPVHNTVNLANDAFSNWSGIALGSSGTLSNTQCTVSGAGSSSVAQGTTVTVKLAVTFGASYGGTKNVYGYATNMAGQASNWVKLGTWAVPGGNQPPQPVSVSPSAGSGNSAVFNLVYSDSNGAGDISSAQVIINPNVAGASSCYVWVDPIGKAVYLANDAFSAWPGVALGSSSPLSNSQCAVNAAASSVSASGSNLTVTLSLNFQSTYSGAKNIFAYTTNAAGLASAWQKLGTFTVTGSSQPPQVVSVTPAAASGTSQVFSMLFSDANGAADLTSAQVIINSAVAGVSSCYLWVDPIGKMVYQANDAFTAFSAIALGSASTQSNSQCTVNGTGSSVSTAGNTLTVNLSVKFAASYAGAKNVYGYATTAGNLNSGWQKVGTFSVTGNTPAVQAVSVTPSAGSGSSATFSLVYSDTLGAADINSAQVIINGGVNGAASCYLWVDPAGKAVYQANDAFTNWSGIALGSSGALSNSQCTVSGTGSSVSLSGNNLTVTLVVSFQTAYAGTQNIYGYATTAGSLNTGWTKLGTFTVPGTAQAPQAVSVTPASGTGMSQVFTYVFSDTKGAADINSAQMIVNSAVAGLNSCYVWVDPAGNAAYMTNDAYTAWPGGPLGKTGTLQNSQCILDLSASSVAISGNNLTVKLSLTFQAAYAGAKNLYGYATTAENMNTGWTKLGTWTVGTASTATITATGGTPQSATIGAAFATKLSATVTSGGNPVSGATVTFTAPASGASGTFANGTNTAVTNAQGVATSQVFTANTIAGAYAVTASVSGAGTPASFQLTNVAGTPVAVSASAGTPQSATISTPFAAQLQALVKDASNNPVGNVTVTFTAPGSGASGTFADSHSNVTTAVTNASGIATAAVFTANTVAGPAYNVVASATGATSASFALTNLAGAAASIVATSGTPQSATAGAAFANPLVATVKDGSGNPVPNATVTFTAPGSGASGTFAGGANTAVTNASGVATSAVFTANATVGGPYNVTATSGAATSANFALTNTAPPAITLTSTTIGQNLQLQGTVTLAQVSASPVSVTLTSTSGSKLVLSTNPAAAGSASTTVTVAAGATTASFYLQSLGNSGTVNYTAAATGYSTGTGTVTESPSGFVVASANGMGQNISTDGSSPVNLTVYAALLDGSLNYVGTTQNLRGGLSVNVSVTSSNLTVGSIVTSPVTIAGNTNSAATTWQANAYGSSVITAVTPSGFSTPVQNASLTATVTGSPTGSLSFCASPSGTCVPSVTVGQNLQVSTTLGIPNGAPSNGLRVTITSQDPTKALVASRPGDPGAQQISFTVPGGTTSLSGIYIQGVANTGSVNVVVSALGFTSAAMTATLTPSGFIIVPGLQGANPIGTNSFSANQGQPVTLTVYPAQLDANLNFVTTAQVAGALSVSVPVTSSITGVGSITLSPVIFNGGDTFNSSTSFVGASQGTTTVSVGVPSGFSLPAQDVSLTASVNAAGLTPGNVSVGYLLANSTNVVLNGVAPSGGLTMTLTSLDASKVLLSTDPSLPGSTQITVTVAAGFSTSPDFWVYSISTNTGTVGYSASAPGFTGANGTVTLVPSGVTITGPNGSHGFITTTGGGNSPIVVYASRLDASLNFVEVDVVAPGYSISVPVTATDVAPAVGVGTITSSPLTINGGNATAQTQFHPTGSGTSKVAAGIPTGFSAPAQFGSLNIQVSVPAITVTDGDTVGQFLQDQGSLLIGQLAPSGGLSVTLTSSDPTKLLLSTSATTAGSGSITVTVPQNGNSATYYIQSLASSGSVSYTATATGYTTGTGTIALAPSGALLLGPNLGSSNTSFTASAGGAVVPLLLRMVVLDPSTHAYAGIGQQLAGGQSLQISFSNTNTSAGTVPSPITFTGGNDRMTVNFTPLQSGSTNITVNTPTGFTTPSSYTTVLGTVQ
jgi:hypothetical protein